MNKIAIINTSCLVKKLIFKMGSKYIVIAKTIKICMYNKTSLNILFNIVYKGL